MLRLYRVARIFSGGQSEMSGERALLARCELLRTGTSSGSIFSPRFPGKAVLVLSPNQTW